MSTERLRRYTGTGNRQATNLSAPAIVGHDQPANAQLRSPSSESSSCLVAPSVSPIRPPLVRLKLRSRRTVSDLVQMMTAGRNIIDRDLHLMTLLLLERSIIYGWCAGENVLECDTTLPLTATSSRAAVFLSARRLPAAYPSLSSAAGSRYRVPLFGLFSTVNYKCRGIWVLLHIASNCVEDPPSTEHAMICKRWFSNSAL